MEGVDDRFDRALVLSNCASMGIQPSEALSLSLWEYSGILHHHNAATDPDGNGEQVEAPDENEMLLAWAHAERMGFGRMLN